MSKEGKEEIIDTPTKPPEVRWFSILKYRSIVTEIFILIFLIYKQFSKDPHLNQTGIYVLVVSFGMIFTFFFKFNTKKSLDILFLTGFIILNEIILSAVIIKDSDPFLLSMIMFTLFLWPVIAGITYIF